MDTRLHDPVSGDAERLHLVQAHHELRTALTSVRSNVELVRAELRDPGRLARESRIVAHLVEVDVALERLERLARTMRAWHFDARQ